MVHCSGFKPSDFITLKKNVKDMCHAQASSGALAIHSDTISINSIQQEMTGVMA